MREQSDCLAASGASQAGRTVPRGAMAQRSAVQLLVRYIWPTWPIYLPNPLKKAKQVKPAFGCKQSKHLVVIKVSFWLHA